MERQDDSIRIRMSILASRRDWALAFDVMKALLACGGKLECEDGNIYTAAQLDDDLCRKLWLEQNGFGLQVQRKHLMGNAEVELPCS